MYRTEQCTINDTLHTDITLHTAGHLVDIIDCKPVHTTLPSTHPCPQSAEMYIEMGKFAMPAKHHEAIAVIYATVTLYLVTQILAPKPI